MELGDYEVQRSADGVATNFIALSRVILGAGVDDRLAWHDVPGDELVYPVVNHQGSTVALLDENAERFPTNSGGRFVYGPFGQTVLGETAVGYPYRYTGRRLDSQTGLYYYRARYYDPEIGRFLQTDPIGYEDQMNLYAYVANDPVNMTDPTGKQGIPHDEGESSPLSWMLRKLPGAMDRAVANEYSKHGPYVESTSEIFFGIVGEVGAGCLEGACGPAGETARVPANVTKSVMGGVQLGRAALARSQVASRVVGADGALKTSQTVARQLAGERSYIPQSAITDVIKGGTRAADPQGAAGRYMYSSQATRSFVDGAGNSRTVNGTLEVLVNETDNVVEHVLFKTTK